MGEQIFDATGNAYGMVVNSDGSINVSGINVAIGSLALTLEDVFVRSGNAWFGTGSVYVANTISVSVGSESYIPAGSVTINNLPVSYPGSVSQSTNPWITLGSTCITNIVPVSGAIVNDFTLRYIQKMDYDNGTNLVYLGLANPGIATNSAGWFIRKLTYTGDYNTGVLFGSGNANFDKVWDSRSGTGEAYS